VSIFLPLKLSINKKVSIKIKVIELIVKYFKGYYTKNKNAGSSWPNGHGI